MENVSITTPYITLGQMMKFANIASSGGDIKALLSEVSITVDGESENRRGRKLYPGMVVKIESVGSFKIVDAQDQ